MVIIFLLHHHFIILKRGRKMKNYLLHIPEGVRDYVWEEAYIKGNIEEKIRNIFKSYSYNLIETPTFEYIDVFTLDKESYQDPKIYKWMNRQGEVVALRSDMTPAIARVIATQNSKALLPQRYHYVSNSFRYPDRYQGKLHEFTQAGIELIGSCDVEADAEIICVAIEALEAVGIRDFTIHLGSAKFLNCLLEDMGATQSQQDHIYEAISKKDGVKIQALLKDTQATQALTEVIERLIQSVGGIELLKEVKQKALSSKALEALEELEAIYNVLVDYGMDRYILFDFSILSYASYYTGMMFQGYTQGIGEAVIEGGRYDKLLSHFGLDRPAVGVAIHVQHLLNKLMGKQMLTLPSKTLILCEPHTRKIARQIACQFRREGLVVEQNRMDSLETARAYAHANKIGGILYFKDEIEVALYDVEKNTLQTVLLTSLLGKEE